MHTVFGCFALTNDGNLTGFTIQLVRVHHTEHLIDIEVLTDTTNEFIWNDKSIAHRIRQEAYNFKAATRCFLLIRNTIREDLQQFFWHLVHIKLTGLLINKFLKPALKLPRHQDLIWLAFDTYTELLTIELIADVNNALFLLLRQPIERNSNSWCNRTREPRNTAFNNLLTVDGLNQRVHSLITLASPKRCTETVCFYIQAKVTNLLGAVPTRHSFLYNTFSQLCFVLI